MLLLFASALTSGVIIWRLYKTNQVVSKVDLSTMCVVMPAYGSHELLVRPRLDRHSACVDMDYITPYYAFRYNHLDL